MKTRYVQIDGELVEVSQDYVPEPQSALVMPDIQPYKSMVTGEMITSRSRHREHLKMHNVIEIGNEDKYLARPRQAPPSGLKQRLIEVANEKLRYK
jgi:hypothetical protein